MHKSNASTMKSEIYKPDIRDIEAAWQMLKKVVVRTPLLKNENISDRHEANVYLKREDLQTVRSYKIRGAYNKICSLNMGEIKNGVVCASAGNHAQGVAYSCYRLKINGTIFMPNTTPAQKINKVRMFGKELVEVVLTGDSFEDANSEAMKFAAELQKAFIHPFNDAKVIEGQGTVALEILQDADFFIDYLFVPVGGGGLASGVSAWFKHFSPETKIVGVEPEGAPAMKTALEKQKVIRLKKIDTFVDGAAVHEVGSLTYDICKDNLDGMITVAEGKLCTTILRMYNEDAIVVEPAGAMSIAALDKSKDKIKGKNVVCVVSGSNNDITRTEEIKERSLLAEGLKHYFIVRFPQRAGALREFLQFVLGPRDDIAFFEYSKKTARETGPAVIGIEHADKDDFQGLVARMKEHQITYEYLNDKPDIFQFLV